MKYYPLETPKSLSRYARASKKEYCGVNALITAALILMSDMASNEVVLLLSKCISFERRISIHTYELNGPTLHHKKLYFRLLK